MLEKARELFWAQLNAIRPAFVSKKPHFNFITVHYFWIICATIICSIAIYASADGNLLYIDALLFSSGSNTQAGLNPVDVNSLNGFQQAMMFLFPLISNPITLHSCVVFLRLYWFEKRFQSWAKDVHSRRPTFSKSKSTARGDAERAISGQGVNGRHITLVPQNNYNTARVTNDGILLDDAHEKVHIYAPGTNSDESSATSATSPTEDGSNRGAGPERSNETGHDRDNPNHEIQINHPGPVAISFAGTVKRSDDMGEQALKIPEHPSHAEHIAILERQRNQDNEVLRIPGPRDAERGYGPGRLEFGDPQDDEENVGPRGRSFDSQHDTGNAASGDAQGRQQAVTIEEPENTKDKLVKDAKAVGGTLDSLRLRKPRLFNARQQKHHEDGGVRQPRPFRTRTMETIRSALTRDRAAEEMPYLSYTPTVGRNSNFLGLTLEQREELGGIEYRSLRTLALILISYFWGFHLLIVTFLWPYILHKDKYGMVVENDYTDRTWWAFFTGSGAFMDVGFTLTPDSMISFQRSQYILMIMWFFIIIGNTGFPVMLRFLIWVFSKLVPRGSGLWEELRFLLDHPRRCFTLLFPSRPNWWLFAILVILNAVDLLFFLVLDLGAEPIATIPLHNRVVIGFFQAASTRTAGFSAVNLAELHPAMPVLYLIMMYISVFPIAISIRRTNVYEEKSLGVYPTDYDEDEPDAKVLSYVGSHLRRQLSFDLWYVFLGFFILAITEGGQIMGGRFNLFAVLFEVVSAYGTVGLSLGALGTNASLCSQFSVVGKLVIIAMQIRGRHRGLPYGLDRAVLLPSESRFKREVEEGRAAGLSRVNTGVSTATTTGLQRQPSHAQSAARERGHERTNSNLIVRLLQPGPVVVRDLPPARRRSRSGSADFSGPPLALRTFTEPPREAQREDMASPLSAALPGAPRRKRRGTFV